jgi:uncharacterized protein YeaO (DUF488 family)
MIQLKRAYAKPSPADGFRVLVERFWPRDLDEKHAKLDLWLKHVAPASSSTRRSARTRSQGAGRSFRGSTATS